MSLPKNITEDLDATQVIDLILILLESHYRRERDKYNDMLEGCRLVNRQALAVEWELLNIQITCPEKSFAVFIRRIQAVLDGGDCPAPTVLIPEKER